MATAATTSTVAGEAWVLMHEVWTSHRGAFLAIANENDLAPGQLGALRELDPEDPPTMGEVARALACDSSNVTGIVDRLEQRGLVERQPGRDDRRVKHLVLTAEGATVRDEVCRRMSEPPDALLNLTDDEATQLRDLLRKALGR